MKPRLVLLCIFATAIGASSSSHAQDESRVEVIEVSGIIDGSVERAVIGGIEAAEAADASLVVLEIDSRGVVDANRTRRIVSRIQRSDVPIATWIGPPGARAENGAADVTLAAHLRAMAPGSGLGPRLTTDLRSRTASKAPAVVLTAKEALDHGDVDVVEASLSDLLESLHGKTVELADRSVVVSSDPETASVRLHKLDLFGRALHAAAKPSISYLLLLLALVGIVFEVFHPSTGPAGVTGAAALALSLYGVVVLGGSWFGVAMIVGGVIAFCIDLRYSSLGPVSALGVVSLVAGSVLLFNGPWLRVSPWVLAFGIVGMTTFMLGAMTRVLRDLRAVARGELEVRDAHPHPNGDGGHDAP